VREIDDGEFAQFISKKVAEFFNGNPPMITGWVICLETMDVENNRLFSFHMADRDSPYWKHLGLVVDAQYDLINSVERNV